MFSERASEREREIARLIHYVAGVGFVDALHRHVVGIATLTLREAVRLSRSVSVPVQ